MLEKNLWILAGSAILPLLACAKPASEPSTQTVETAVEKTARTTLTVKATLEMEGFTSSEVIAGFRVSDFGANFHWCQAADGDAKCSVSDDSHFPPKNIGNILCLPKSLNDEYVFVVTGQCEDYLDEAGNECKVNSARNDCPSDYFSVLPPCNWTAGLAAGENVATMAWTVKAGTVEKGAPYAGQAVLQVYCQPNLGYF